MEKKDMITVISQLVKDVRQLRMEADKLGKWVTPTPEDCLAFAVTEIAEVVDARLREKPEYARNTEKKTDVAGELGDTAIMLASYIIAGEFGVHNLGKWVEPATDTNNLAQITSLVSEAWRVLTLCDAPDAACARTTEALCRIITYLDHYTIPVMTTFLSRINRLKKRWVIDVKAQLEPLEYPEDVRLLVCPACSLLFLPERELCSLCQCRLKESNVYQPTLFKFIPHNLQESRICGSSCECDGGA